MAIKKPNKKWMAGYGSYMDWYIMPATPENENEYANTDGDYYPSFAQAKKALIDEVKRRIDDDRNALKMIRLLKQRQPGSERR